MPFVRGSPEYEEFIQRMAMGKAKAKRRGGGSKMSRPRARKAIMYDSEDDEEYGGWLKGYKLTKRDKAKVKRHREQNAQRKLKGIAPRKRLAIPKVKSKSEAHKKINMFIKKVSALGEKYGVTDLNLSNAEQLHRNLRDYARD